MKKFLLLGSLAGLVFFLLSFDSIGSAKPGRQAFNDSLDKDRAKYVAIIKEKIKGKEKMPVDSVFSNLKVLGGFAAENLPLAMNSWSRALGVSCGHCHNTEDFASDEIPKKAIARQMVDLGSVVNQKLKTINGLSDRPIVNCTTCHRGELKPALRLPENQ